MFFIPILNILRSMIIIYPRLQFDLFTSLFLTSSVANWGLPLAALGDLKKDPEIISGKMTAGEMSSSHTLSEQIHYST